MTKEEKNARQREIRQKNGNKFTKKYEKTSKGFAMRMYRNMQSRIKGIQYAKKHLYEGLTILPRQEFYDWLLNSETFKTLFAQYEASGYQRKLAPSVDRVDSSKGYELSNMEIVTMSENSRRGSVASHNLKNKKKLKNNYRIQDGEIL